ncbi:MAG: hypothetical protein WC340_10455 [Kiritimatiellia bacterium]
MIDLEQLHHIVTKVISQWDEKFTFLSVAALGGIASFLISGKYKWVELITSVFLAVFIGGYLAPLVCQLQEYSTEKTNIICALGGLISRDAARMLKRYTCQRAASFLGLPAEKTEKK